MLSHYVVHLKLVLYDMSTTLQFKKEISWTIGVQEFLSLRSCESDFVKLNQIISEYSA